MAAPQKLNYQFAIFKKHILYKVQPLPPPNNVRVRTALS